MPYVFVEELAEGQEAAEVFTPDEYNALEEERDSLIAERDSLRSELDGAKTRFADAFLSSPQGRSEPPHKEEYVPKTFSSLF